MGSTQRKDDYEDIPTGELKVWTEEEAETLFTLKESGMKWAAVATNFPGKTQNDCRDFYHNCFMHKYGGEIKYKVACLYESYKEKMWAKIAEEMEVPWKEVELNHWRLGKEWMKKRARDKSFLTREERFQFMPCYGLPPPPLVDKDAQRSLESYYINVHEWSGAEEQILSECREHRMGWSEISRRLPGRTARDCVFHYVEDMCKAGGWPSELQTELSRLYQSSRLEMWTEIGNQLQISWKSAERIHWILGAEGILGLPPRR
ncbi:hypothetical protein E4U58_006531 [Claviceps cyperi]|nr:hypothetical protein E4U58_006531 [Claviceps cyperi]